MTIYSSHPSRGKTQIFAARRTRDGAVVSSTVTSVPVDYDAAGLVKSLNRVSAAATAPLEARGFLVRTGPATSETHQYPHTHISALVDPSQRRRMFDVAFCPWYHMVMWDLYISLADLDNATASLPAPIQTALDDELRTESDLLMSVANRAPISGNITPLFDSLALTVREKGTHHLDSSWALKMNGEYNRNPRDESDRLSYMKLLSTVALELPDGFQPSNLLTDMGLYDRYYTEEGLSMGLEAPGGQYDKWTLEITRTDGSNVDSVVACHLGRPDLDTSTIKDLIATLRSSRDQERLATWATTRVGDCLPGTKYQVSSAYPLSD